MPARTPAPFDLQSLHNALPKIFDQAQTTAANHQKNFVALYKLHSEAAAITEPIHNGKSLKLTGERTFEDVFHDMVMRVLPLKKGTTVADRTVKFIAGYTKFITEKNMEERKKSNLDEDEDTTSERFLSHLVHFLLKGCTAKDKVVRFRVIQCIADTISHLGEIDEDLYTSLRAALLDRLRDKEPTVRTQAVIALTKLSYSEDPSELQDGEPSILETILDAMAHDISPDVRRAAVLNIPLHPQTLSALLARSRDIDPTIRKLVYTNVLEKYCLPTDRGPASTVGFTHPRALTIAQREMIVRNGLGDREESVKAAARKLLGAWVDVVRSDGSKKEEAVKSEGVIEDMVAFLKLFDLTEDTIAEDALSAVLEVRMDIYEHMEFPEDYWSLITPERAFLARVFIDKCVAKEDTHKMDATLPVVTAMAFRIQDAYNALVQHVEEDAARAASGLDADDEDARARREEVRLDREFAIGELLRLAVRLDYGDEIGRRKMFQLVQGMLAQDILPEALLARCLDVLRVLSPNERDLIRVVVEVVHELRDPSEPEAEVTKADVDDNETEMGSPRRPARVANLPKPVAEMSPEEKARADAVDLRCLALCIGMLERVNGTFEENSTLEGILGELIIPAVKRREMALREKGLISLGLCCLIARRMALSSFQLFLSQVQSAPEVLKIRVLQIIFDILMVHEGAFLGPGSPNGEKIVEFLLQLLEAEEAERVQALLVVGIAKLMLSGMVTDERVLQTLVLTFISPETATNQELRQCLSYFFPVYSYSSPANQQRMRKIFVPLYERLTVAYRDWDGDEDMVTPAQVALMFVDWTDPLRAAEAAKGLRKDSEKDPIHVDLATDVIKALFSVDYDKEDKKALCQMLGKLYLPDEVDEDKVRILKLLLTNLRSRRPPRDTAAKNALAKFDAALSKKYERQLENFSEDEFRKLEELRELFEFLDDIIPDYDDEDEAPKKGRKRRSLSVATETTTSAATSGDRSPPPSPRGGKSKAKRRRVSHSDDDSDEDDARTETSRASPAPAPTRAVPKRSAAEKSKKAVSKAFQPIVISSDDEDDDEDEDGDEDDVEATPVAKPRVGARRAPAPKPSRAKQAAQIDADIDELLEADMTKDSIMDSSEDDEADEVEDIL